VKKARVATWINLRMPGDANVDKRSPSPNRRVAFNSGALPRKQRKLAYVTLGTSTSRANTTVKEKAKSL
jgi:hypothetical protein